MLYSQEVLHGFEHDFKSDLVVSDRGQTRITADVSIPTMRNPKKAGLAWFLTQIRAAGHMSPVTKLVDIRSPILWSILEILGKSCLGASYRPRKLQGHHY